MAQSVYSRACQKAAELLGGRNKLAESLRVSKGDLDKWIADEAKPPREIFLRIVDLILDETAPAQESEPQDPQPPHEAIGRADQYPD